MFVLFSLFHILWKPCRLVGWRWFPLWPEWVGTLHSLSESWHCKYWFCRGVKQSVSSFSVIYQLSYSDTSIISRHRHLSCTFGNTIWRRSNGFAGTCLPYLLLSEGLSYVFQLWIFCIHCVSKLGCFLEWFHVYNHLLFLFCFAVSLALVICNFNFCYEKLLVICFHLDQELLFCFFYIILISCD